MHQNIATTIQVGDVGHALNMPPGRETLIAVGRALRYWINRGALDADHKATLDDGIPLMVIRGLTPSGYDVLENRANASPHTIVNAANVGVVGSMSGGVVNQTSGATFSDLVAALEKLVEVAAETDSDAAAVVEPAVAGALGELRLPQPNETKVRRVLTGIGATIQTLGELGPAWALVAAEPPALVGVSRCRRASGIYYASLAAMSDSTVRRE